MEFREIVVADFEFEAPEGERPVPVCLCAKELRSGREFRLFQDQLGPAPPYATGPDVLFVAFAASAEFSCYKVLGWKMPENVLDLYVEFRRKWCKQAPHGFGITGALTYYGLSHHLTKIEKDTIRKAIGDGSWRHKYTPQQVLDYCWTDIDATTDLLNAMRGELEWPRLLLRGSYMWATAVMQHNGLPLDVELLDRLKVCWKDIQLQLIPDVDKPFGFYEGTTFKVDRLTAYVIKHGIPWPLLKSGELDTSDEAFRDVSALYPELQPVRELRATLSALHNNSLVVGSDGRNRVHLAPFVSVTSRNQPSNTRFICGLSKFMRGLIQARPGFAIAHIDWEQQEFGIAAALSGDANMQAAYNSGDAYLGFAKLAGAVPQDATKESHKAIRNLYKRCILATQYGMSSEALSRQLNLPPIVGQNLMRAHHEVFSRFWHWVERVVDYASLHNVLHTRHGWLLNVEPDFNPRMVQNFLMQANGAEILRVACCYAIEAGIELCAPVHDAVFIHAPADRIEHDIAVMKGLMAKAGRVVLGGFQLRAECKRAEHKGEPTDIAVWPDRYMHEDGAAMWHRVMGYLAEAERRRA